MIVYIAGPYRAVGGAGDQNGVHENIERARAAAVAVWQMGATALCPHLNSANMDGACADWRFLDGGLELLAKCDAVYCFDDKKWSKGTQREIREAVKLHIPVFFDLTQLKAFVDGHP